MADAEVTVRSCPDCGWQEVFGPGVIAAMGGLPPFECGNCWDDDDQVGDVDA